MTINFQRQLPIRRNTFPIPIMLRSAIDFLLYPIMRKKGFTLVDVLLTFSIIAITAGVSVPVYQNYKIRSDLDLAVVQVVHGLSRAQLLSQTGKEDGRWGYRVPEGTVFLGENFVVRDTDEDEVIVLPPGISVFGIKEVVFARVTGVPSPTGDIILEASNGERRTITVGQDGTLSATGIEEADFADTGSDTGAQTGGDTGVVGGDTGSATGGETGGNTGAESGGGDSGGGDGEPTCEDRFSVTSDGAVETTGTVTMTVKALGASITYGAGGPEVQVTSSVSTDGGTTWNSLFGGAEIDGGEQQIIPNIVSGERVLLRVNGRYGWLFNKTFTSNDGTGHIRVLRNGDTPPDVQAFDNQTSLSQFLQAILDEEGNISIGAFDVILLSELGSLSGSTADFQDAVLLLSFAQHEGSCAKGNDPKLKITFERLENTGKGNAKKQSFVGQAGWAYGDGQWIPLLSPDGQVATDAGLTETVEGLAVERKNGYVRVLLHGSHGQGSKEIVDARVTLEGAKITMLANDTGTNAMENPFDKIVNDGSGGDEASVAVGSGSLLFQARVTTADDAVSVHWTKSVSGGGTGGSTGGDGGDASGDDGGAGDGGDTDEDGFPDEDDDGDGDNDDGIEENEISDACAAQFAVESGRIVLQEGADVTFQILGSESRYGGGNGPEIEVRLNASTNGGSTWRSLFGFRDVDGGENETLADLPSGSSIVLQAEGRRGWLFREVASTADGSGRMKLLSRGQSDPNTTIYTKPASLKSFVRNRINKRKISIQSNQILLLAELQELGNGADFQDVAVLITIEKPASKGICGKEESDTGDAGRSGSASSAGNSGSAGSAGSTSSSNGSEGTPQDPEIQICHFPPGNPRNHKTITVGSSAWSAHASHGDRRGPCEGDEDGDGILNSEDLCPNTYVPEPVPSEFMLFKRYALTQNSFIFRVGPRKEISDFTLKDTTGCSCEQLIDVAEGVKEYRFGQFPRVLRQMQSLFPFYTEGARRNGCGKAVLDMIKKNISKE